MYYSGDRAAAKTAYEKAIGLARKKLEVNPKDAEVLGDVTDYYAMVADRKNALASLNQFVKDQAQRKKICPPVKRFLLQNLRGHVTWCAAQ